MNPRVGTWPIPKFPKSPSNKTQEKVPQLWVEPAFGANGFYPDCHELFVILTNLTKLVSQQQVFVDGKKIPFRHEMNPVVKKMMKTQDKLGAAQLDGRSFVTKANFIIHNYCVLLSLMITTNAFVLPRNIPFKVLKVNDESKHWETTFGSESLNVEKARPNFDETIHDPYLNALKNQNLVQLTPKGIKDTLANICYIGFKIDYYYNLEIIYGSVGLGNRDGEVDSMDLYDFHGSESNPTPRTAFTRIKGIGDRIMEGVYDSYPEFVRDGKKGMMVNEFLIYWPLVSGYLLRKEHTKHFKNCLKGSLQTTLKDLMSSLKIKGYDAGGHIPISKSGNPMFKNAI